MCKKLLSLLLSLTILLGAVWVPVAAGEGDPVDPVEPVEYVTITLKPNGGTPNINQEFEVIKNSDFTPKTIEQLDPPLKAPAGKKFLGWARESSSTTKLNFPIKATGNISLVAMWTEEEYTVTFDLNGCPGTALSPITVTYNAKYGTLPTLDDDADNKFAGWWTKPIGGTEVTSTTEVTATSDHILYAHWTKQCTVTFDPKGGSVTPTTKTYDEGAKYVTLPTPATTDASKEFAGWFIKENPTDNDVAVKTTDTVSSTHTLYAKWTTKQYTVTFNANGGTFAEETPSTSVQVDHGTTFKNIDKPEVSRDGYDPDGWSTVNGTEIGDGYAITKTETLYAHWKAKNYTISFDYNFPTKKYWGDSVQEPTISTTSTATFASRYPKLPDPAAKAIPYYDENSTKQYTFAGWYNIAKDKVDTTDPTDPEKNVTGQKITGGTNGNSYNVAGNQTLYARWGYEIEFYANSSASAATESVYGKLSCVTGAAYDIKAIPKDPSRKGYTFAGWYKSAAPNSANRVELTASDIADGSVNKLYAHWTPSNYTVTLVPNGGEMTNKTIEVTFGSAYPALPAPDDRQGYTFKGWFTEKDGGTPVTTTVTRAEDHTLYARWAPLELTLKFNYNLPAGIQRNKDTHPDIAPAKATYGAYYSTALPARNPLSVVGEDKTTYAFKGWYTTDKDANAGPSGTGEVTGQQVGPSDHVELKYSGTPAAATLHARWKYSVNFYANVNPAAANESPVGSIEAVCGSRYGTLPGQPVGNPSRYFLGWFKDREGTQEVKETDIADGTTVKLYAKWGNIRTCTVTISGNGAALPAGCPSFEIIEYGQDLSKIFDNISAPTRDGYTFAGWYLDAGCTGSAVTSGYIVREDLTLYAKWVIDSFKVTFDLNYSGSSDIVKSADHGALLSEVMPSPIPERAGYAFDGWYTDRSCDFPADTAAAVTADVTLYAKWTEATRIDLVVGGGTLPEGTPSYINVYEGGTYQMLPDPTWLGCTFLGWYTQPERGVKVNRSDTVIDAGSIPTTLYAQWSAMSVTVNFNTNGSPGSSRSSTYKVGSTYGGNGIGLPTPATWTGHEFMGWYTQSVGGSKVESSTVVSVTSNDTREITLFAHWGYIVTFDPNTGNGTMEPETVDMNQPYTMPECTFTPPAGKRFNGWAIGSASSLNIYPSGSQYTVSRHTYLYATWAVAPLAVTATYTPGGTLMTEDGRTNEVVVERGQDITFVASPLPGFVLKELIVDGENYNYTVRHTFRKVTENHTIHAVFERIGLSSYITCGQDPSCPLSKYGDLDVSSWYHDAVHYCLDNVIMSGTGPSTFLPGARTTRAQVATCLYSYAGRPSIDSNGPLPHTFTDVKAGAWYYQPVEWAARNGYVSGYGNGKFGPDDPVTREQLVAILWQHAGRPQPSNGTLRGFYDASQVSSYAWTPMCWATEQGILSGRPGGLLAPKGYATRVEVAQMLKNYFELK